MSLDAIGIVSRDIPASVQFYRFLGIDLRAAGGDEHWEGTTPGGVRVMLDSIDLMKKLNPGWKEPVGSGVVLCFKQDSPESVNTLFTMLTQAGYRSVKDPWDAFWGQRYASVFDPDGNQVDLFAPLSS